MGPISPRFNPLCPIFGLQVTGVDLREALSDELKRALREAWHRSALLLFRDQQLSPEQVDRAAGIFGEVRTTNPWGDFEDRQYISNVIPEAYVGDGELLFHMDLSFMEQPLRGLALYAYEVPPEGVGGDTLFANVQLAYERLPAALRERLEELRIVHTTRDAAPQWPVLESVHPIAFPHPVTGETVLYCSPRHFQEIVGLEKDAGRALCEELEREISRPEIVYRHVWRAGDLVVWDNIRLQHARTNFDRKYRRHLRRTQIAA